MREIDEIIVHTSFTRPSMDVGADWIRDIHVHQNGWSAIGYHEILRRNGTVELGRPAEKIGAHTRGHNRNSYGMCLIGGMSEDGNPDSNYTFRQLQTLYGRLQWNVQRFGITKISGHRDYANKDCPCFDIKEFFNLDDFLKAN